MGVDKKLKVRSTPSNDLVHLNLIYVHKDLFPPSVTHIKIKDNIFCVSPHQDIQPDEVAMNAFQRKATQVAPGEPVVVQPFTIPTKGFVLDTISLEMEFLVKRATTVKIDGQKFVEVFRRRYINQVFAVGQTWAIDFEGTNYVLCANDLSCIDEETLQVCQSNLREKPLMGIVGPDTNPILKVTSNDGKYIKLTNLPSSSVASSRSSELFKKDFNFETLGIGGLNKEFGDIFRRAFASRIFPPSVLQKLGIQHVKGILLYGPPGTGKTLMARQIGKMLNCQEPKVVNGPEIMSKYVGESEANIRKLFEGAEAEYRSKGDDSDLHLVIFDEIDAICKSRGTSRDGTGVNDAVVNQLLSKIDGVEAIPNVLLIGMTNRKDLIDEAMLRPGRFEVQIEISLPNEEGRLQIFTIHTTSIKKNGFMETDVDLLELAQKARNFSGAEIEGLVKSAVSFAFNRQVDVNNIGKPIDPNSIRIGRADFMAAFEEVKPAFGVEEEELDKYIRNGLFDYGASWQGLLSTCMSFTHQLSTSIRTSSLSVLLEGLPASGKTALAAHIAKSSQFPYVKVVSGENMVGYSEIAKCNLIRKVFDDAYKSPFNVIILDDLERLVEYVHIGPRFSNSILQTLLVLIKKQPPKDRKLLIIGTTSSHEVLESMELTSVFNATVTVPQLSNSLGEVSKVLSFLNVHFVSKDEEAQALSAIPSRIGIKNLILVVEMAQASVTHGRDGQPALLTKSALVQALSTCKCDV